MLKMFCATLKTAPLSVKVSWLSVIGLGLVNIKLFSLLSFRRILGSVDQALARRRRALKQLQKELKKSGSEKVLKIFLKFCFLIQCSPIFNREKLTQKRWILPKAILTNWIRTWGGSWSILTPWWGRSLGRLLTDTTNSTGPPYRSQIPQAIAHPD